jgi:hypothetical protein
MHELGLAPVRRQIDQLHVEAYLLGYDRELCAAVLDAFVKELSRRYRRRAKQVHGLPSIALAHSGAVTVVQRTDSALRLSAIPWDSIPLAVSYMPRMAAA